jgi:CHASE2 domain-containing sensor protein
MAVLELVQSLGFGEQVTVAVVALLGVLYLFRARSATKRVFSVVGTLWIGTVAVLLTTAVAIYLGWVDPSPTVFISDALTAIETGARVTLDALSEWLPGF